MLSRPPASFASRTRLETASSRLSVSASAARDPVLPDHRGQAVGAQQVDVPGPRPVGHRVHLDLALGPQRPGDDRALRVVLRLLVGEAPLAAELLDQRVIGGQELQLAVAEQVGAAVPDVGEADLVVLDQGGGERGPHSRAGGVGLGQAVDAGVGRPGDRPQVGLRRFLAAPHGLERLRREPRGDLARLRAAHAVGDREQRPAGEVRVLVGVALAPRVGAMGLLDDPQHQCRPPTLPAPRARTGTRCRRSAARRGR